MYDLIIIGGGPAGLTAAVYAARAGLDFAVLEQDGWGGGQIVSAGQVDNFPGLPGISGMDLGDKFREHAEKLGTEILSDTVERVVSRNGFLETEIAHADPLQSRTVIAATGAVPRRLGIPGETQFLGKGVSYCATCDGDFFKNQNVAVIGGGDTAVEDALFLSNICDSVTLVHRREVFRAAKTRIELLKSRPNVSLRLNETVREITGSEKAEGLELSAQGGGTEHLDVQGVFVAVGVIPVTDYLKDLPLTMENGYIEANETGKTQVPGLFVAGDIRRKRLRQVVTAAADGANAAVSAVDFLTEQLTF